MNDQVLQLLQEALAQQLFPGFALEVRKKGQVLFQEAGGLARLEPKRKVEIQTPWDLASLTKVLATTGIVVRLVAEGSLGLEDPVCRWVEGVDRELEVRHLLQHSGGYPAWRPFFEEFSSLKPGSMEVKAAILEAIVQTPLQSRPGIQHCYSDLGFLLLQAVVECCGELSLRELFQKLVQEPAGVELCFGWPGAAATENCPVRGRVMEGEVHDLNAWWLGGVAGHAGLFGPVGEVGKLAEWWLQGFKGENTLLPQSLVARFWQSKGPGSHQLGWDGVTPGASSAGSLWPKDGVGHLGFTGCSLWIAPKQEVIVTLLTNRVHPVVEGGARPGQSGPKTTAFRAWRPRLYTAVWEGLSG